MKKLLVLLVYVVCVCSGLLAQGHNRQYLEYIEKYKEYAISEMQKHRIPASITLAQGLLESAAGKSTLARYSNNHFGIKCGLTWTGETVYHNDDRPNECFREYDDPKQSFEDHSLFLVKNKRYASLFSLDITDFRAWAHGLKQAGYATNPRYGILLVSLIEQYRLYEYDRVGLDREPVRPKSVNLVRIKKSVKDGPHQTYLSNGLVYVIARQGDTWESLSRELGISARKLCKYNEYSEDYRLQSGDIVYLKKKNKKAAKGNAVHTMSVGESMHSISQKYGIRLKNLYKMNRMDSNSSTPKVGFILKIR